MYRIGIDLGGTNTVAGLVDENGRIVDRESVKTNLPTDLGRIVRDIDFLCRTLMERHSLENEEICPVGKRGRKGFALEAEKEIIYMAVWMVLL